MPILSELSRRFQMLTTDAKPDPPRTGVPGYTHNLPPTEDEETKKTRSKSMPEELHAHKNDKGDDGVNVTASVRRQKSVPNDATPTRDFCAKAEDLGDTGPTNESKEYKRPRTRTKTKHGKYCKYKKYIVALIVKITYGKRISFRVTIWGPDEKLIDSPKYPTALKLG